MQEKATDYLAAIHNCLRKQESQCLAYVIITWKIFKLPDFLLSASSLLAGKCCVGCLQWLHVIAGCIWNMKYVLLVQGEGGKSDFAKLRPSSALISQFPATQPATT